MPPRPRADWWCRLAVSCDRAWRRNFRDQTPDADANHRALLSEMERVQLAATTIVEKNCRNLDLFALFPRFSKTRPCIPGIQVKRKRKISGW
jgi:hypothetical protein